MKTLSHFFKSQNLITASLMVLAFSPARADYKSTVLADEPKAYYRFNDNTNQNLINSNSGSLGAAGNASNDLAFVTGGIVHPFPGAIAGEHDRSEFFDFTTRTEIPFNASINTPDAQAFTVEAWLYPASDQVSTGMGALCNRWTQDSQRQGWVIYQRAPDTNHCTSCGPGVGWELRMYNGLDSDGHIDVTSGVPFSLGEWQHVVVVYTPVDDSSTNGIATIYINGVEANSDTNSGDVPGYAPCTGDHDPSVAVNGQPAMSLGGYNNANGGLDGFENPWFGAIDEFAWYPTALTPAQILAHYQNGTNAQRSQPYESLIQSDNPAVYLRLDEIAPSPNIANNLGDLRSLAIGTNDPGEVHPATSALAGRTDDGASSYHQRNGSSTTDLPFQAANNPDAGTPFTLETWLRPTSDRISPGAAPINNRYVNSGHRTGWVIFQRAPDASYAGYTPDYEGTGWTFRMYDGVDSTSQDVLTDSDWIPGVWQHLVVTWQPQTENGDVGDNGNDQWEGILTAYMDGLPVATNQNALYAANVNPTEDGTIPADFAVGSYNMASGLGANPYEGDVDELALYNNIILTSDQIMAHYQAGTNADYGANYETLVYSAGLFSTVNGAGQSQERVDLPTLYLRFNEPAYFGATNSGTLGFVADGSLVLTTNSVSGPESPAYAGFEATNEALTLDGMTQFASFNNPAGLDISGRITLEAWILPSAVQGTTARIISHGPQTISDYLGAMGGEQYGPFDNAITNTVEDFLRIDGGGANYSVGSAQYSDATGVTNFNEATVAVPIGDLGGTNWIHLVGTYDGTYWNLYRNGLLLASQASATGALPVTNGNWAIGATGEGWADNFAGAVDEVAVYDKALSPSQVASHYLVGHTGSASLSIVPAAGGKVTITWPAGTTLQQSSTLSGVFTAVTGSPISPLTITATGTEFYRWSLP